MSSFGSRVSAAAMVLLLIASAATAIVAGVSVVERSRAAPEAEPRLAAVPLVVAPSTPIAAEAEVFRTQPEMLALAPATPRERSAHPRTRTTYRFLRAFPGAPPHIPHPLSADEFRTGTCKSCHERGGYSTRFNAYVPLTPHADRGVCLECHVGEDVAMGVASPDADPNSRCAICHGGGGRPQQSAASTWPTSVWPELPALTPGESPPAIPHSVQFRERCVTCHSGPAAVAEIRTKHPDRANCRQCHLVPDPDAAPFARPMQTVALGTGSKP